ncbi:DUF4198 domain-containing protein [Aliarcobacter vitoriensis]|uniref:DUF4198 domain-containing protein n=1 Tax=Aliarcobacter vitoriensis TaxID=2011099 RepID=UPI003AB02887
MIKKLGLVVIFTTLSTVQSLAHDFWVDGYNSSTFKATLGYGHDFTPEKIAEDRVSIFEPLVLIDKDLKSTTLKNEGENYQYVSKKALDDGSYILKGTYKPTLWTKTSDNKWHIGKTKKDFENAQYCQQTSMFAKNIVNIGNDKSDFVTKPIGQNLEIIPLDNPANFKVGVPFKIQVLLDGKPAKTVEVKGTFDGFPSNKFAFLGTTDLKGEIEITALRSGKWILMTKSKKAYENDTCDEVAYSASLTFQVN